MTSDQEAVCGTCGVYRVRIDKSCPHCGADFIPAPVVPSDDERCEVCGDILYRGECQTCLAVGAIPLDAAPPTSSQDAEGDGWRKKREDGDFGVWADFYQGRPISPFYVVPHGVESSIRDPYEELVKALRLCGDAIVGIEWKGVQSSQHGSEVMISERSYDRLMEARDLLRTLAKENGPAFQALTRIEESLGGRS